MVIITHKALFVNSKKFKNWTMKKELNNQMADKMIKVGLTSRGTRMAECSDTLNISFCPDCGKYEITKAHLCRDRLCPICSWRLSLKRYAEMNEICTHLLKIYPNNKWAFMTLTVQNCDASLLDVTLKKMADSFNRMRQRKVFKDEVIGWARTVEVTFNKKTNEVHPHYHILLLWKEDTDTLHNGAILLNYWLSAARELMVSYKAQNIEDIKASVKDEEAADITGAVLETFKYTQKSTDLLNMPTKIFREFAVNMAGKRCISFGGVIKKALAELHITADDEIEELKEFTVCTNCGSAALSNALYKWSFAERSYLLNPEH